MNFKTNIISFLLLVAPLTLPAQSPGERTPDEVVGENAFTSVDVMPQFPGGQVALIKHISQNLTYPADAVEAGVKGRVTVRFVVAKDGNIVKPTIVRGVHPSLDREALRVVGTLPKFVPGSMNGEPVNVFYTLPITFK